MSDPEGPRSMEPRRARPAVTNDEVYALTSANRRLIADFLESLDDRQWQAPSLCAGWTVGDVAAHLLQPMVVPFRRVFLLAFRYRGNIDKAIDTVTRHLATRPRAQTIETLRQHASDRVSPPMIGPMGPFGETCIHLRDMARPLGLDVSVPAVQWLVLLDYLVSPRAARALGAGRAGGLRLTATDLDWSHGTGAPVSGPAEALTLALAGRAVALADLAGEGAELLRTRLAEPV